MTHTQEVPPRSVPQPLWRNLRFQALWIGVASSTLGVSVADIAYPLVILALTGSPARAGLFAAVQTLGTLIAGLPAGSLADRYEPRLIVVVTEACRAIITTAVVVALVTGWLSLPLLLAAGALLGAGQAACTTCRIMLLRSVVTDEQLTAALIQDQVRANGAAMAGPAIGGALYSIRALSRAVPFIFTAASFVVALTTAALLPGRAAHQKKEDDEPQGGAAGSDGMLAGLRMLWNHPLLRPAMILSVIMNTVGSGLDLVLIVLLRHQAVPAGEIGLALGIGYAGSIAGMPLVKILHKLGPGVLMLGMSLLWVLAFALLSLPLGPWWVASMLFIALLFMPAVQVAGNVLFIKTAPAEQRGRLIAAGMVMLALGIPAGVSGCGLLLQYVPPQAAMLILTGILAAGLGYAATKRALWQARWPSPTD